MERQQNGCRGVQAEGQGDEGNRLLRETEKRKALKSDSS
jgi:hypothetical protein